MLTYIAKITDDMGDGHLFGLLQENKVGRSKRETIFQNMVKFIPRQYLPFNQAYSKHIRSDLHCRLSLELQFATWFSDARERFPVEHSKHIRDPNKNQQDKHEGSARDQPMW